MKFYITAAIPYVNSAPHLGHALEFVQCDAIARYARIRGKKTLLLTGADENSLKNVQAAEKAGITPQMLCDINSNKFQKLLKALNTNFDVFHRATDKCHFFGSQQLWNLCKKKGDIYKRKYEGLYCIGCEAFYTPDELTERGLCIEHQTVPQKISEENYFFRLSKYQKILYQTIAKDRIKIIPDKIKKEVLSFINMGLDDFSISRSVSRAKNWGVPVPDDTDQIMYVWFDALNIYQTGIGFGSKTENYLKWWPADLHVIGKGIIRFHAVYWPAILLSAGLPLPKSIFVHGYITIEGEKMSKSLGNIIDPNVLIDEYGIDALRYYLLKEIPSSSDGDFSLRRFKELYNSDLANGLGNLISRVARLCENKQFPNVTKKHFEKEYMSRFNNYQLDKVLELVWQKIRILDKYINDSTPWKITDEKKLLAILSGARKIILDVAFDLLPFLPTTANKILLQFGTRTIISQPPLFPRLNK